MATAISEALRRHGTGPSPTQSSCSETARSIATNTAAALVAVSALASVRLAAVDACCFLVCESEGGQRQAGEADAEFLQRLSPRDRLGQALGEFIEWVVHIFSFWLLVVVSCSVYAGLRKTDMALI